MGKKGWGQRAGDERQNCEKLPVAVVEGAGVGARAEAGAGHVPGARRVAVV